MVSESVGYAAGAFSNRNNVVLLKTRVRRVKDNRARFVIFVTQLAGKSIICPFGESSCVDGSFPF